MKTPARLNPWIWITLLIVSALTIISLFFIHSGIINAAIITGISTIVVGLGSIISAILKYSNSFKERIYDQDSKIDKMLSEVRQETTVKISKNYENLINKQIEFSNKTTDFLVDTFIKIENDINGVSNQIKDIRHDLKERIDEVKISLIKVTDDVNSLQLAATKTASYKSKQESWARELEKDWDGCKARIQTIDDKELLNGAIIVKDLFIDFANEILSWNLYTSNESEKSMLISRINERFDSFYINISAQLPQMIHSKQFIDEYYTLNKANVVGFKIKIEKSFRDNIINNISKNIFNYSSQYLNETLNTLACAYVKTNGIKLDGATRCK